MGVDLLVALLGVADGMIDGVFGVGGGVVFVPALVFFLGMSQVHAQSTFPSTPWAIAPHSATRMIAASDVDVARFAPYPAKATRIGTITMPPPTPKSAETSPAAPPAKMSAVRMPVALVASATVSVSSAALACAPLVQDPSAAALLVDLDGTLAPIVARPQDAAVIDGAREALIALRDRMGLVGFISGRGLEDLRRIVGIPGCTYVGNHGFEMQDPDGGVRIAADARAWLPAISGLVDEWREGLAGQSAASGATA